MKCMQLLIYLRRGKTVGTTTETEIHFQSHFAFVSYRLQNYMRLWYLWINELLLVIPFCSNLSPNLHGRLRSQRKLQIRCRVAVTGGGIQQLNGLFIHYVVIHLGVRRQERIRRFMCLLYMNAQGSVWNFQHEIRKQHKRLRFSFIWPNPFAAEDGMMITTAPRDI